MKNTPLRHGCEELRCSFPPDNGIAKHLPLDGFQIHQVLTGKHEVMKYMKEAGKKVRLGAADASDVDPAKKIL
jgi:hypothetical protein